MNKENEIKTKTYRSNKFRHLRFFKNMNNIFYKLDVNKMLGERTI